MPPLLSDESTFRLIFAALFLSVAAFRLHYHRKASTFLERQYTEAEGRVTAAFRGLLGVAFYIGAFAYLISPEWMSWSALSLPVWLRWTGVGVGIVTVLLLFSVNHALGRNFSSTIRIREDHMLVTHGPYRRVRHPMYTVSLLMVAAAFLLSANWFVGITGILAMTLLIVVRTPKEEAQLIEQFGDQYREYMKYTRRFLPRLIRLREQDRTGQD